MTLDIHNPPTDLSLENLAQIATSLEHSAAATYCRLAAEMGKLHNPEAVQVFERNPLRAVERPLFQRHIGLVDGIRSELDNQVVAILLDDAGLLF